MIHWQERLMIPVYPQRHQEAESTLRLGEVKAQQDLAGKHSDMSARYHEALHAAKAKNILIKVEKELSKEPGLIGDCIRRLTEAIGEGALCRYSHQARLRRSELLVSTCQVLKPSSFGPPCVSVYSMHHACLCFRCTMRVCVFDAPSSYSEWTAIRT